MVEEFKEWYGNKGMRKYEEPAQRKAMAAEIPKGAEK